MYCGIFKTRAICIVNASGYFKPEKKNSFQYFKENECACKM